MRPSMPGLLSPCTVPGLGGQDRGDDHRDPGPCASLPVSCGASRPGWALGVCLVPPSAVVPVQLHRKGGKLHYDLSYNTTQFNTLICVVSMYDVSPQEMVTSPGLGTMSIIFAWMQRYRRAWVLQGREMRNRFQLPCWILPLRLLAPTRLPQQCILSLGQSVIHSPLPCLRSQDVSQLQGDPRKQLRSLRRILDPHCGVSHPREAGSGVAGREEAGSADVCLKFMLP